MSTLYWDARRRLKQRGKGFPINIIRVKLFGLGLIMGLVKLGLYAIEVFLSGIVEISPAWALALTITHKFLSGGLLILWGLLFLSLLGWLIKGASFLWPLFEKEEVGFKADEAVTPAAEEIVLTPEEKAASETLETLEALTDKAIADKARAATYLADAATYSDTLFALVEGFVQKGLHYKGQADLLRRIIRDDGSNLAGLAQDVADGNLRATVKQQANITALGPKSKAALDDFAQAFLTDYARQVYSFDAFVAKLLGKLGDTHKQLTDAQTYLQQDNTMEPMMLLLGNLQKAQGYLVYPSLMFDADTGATTANVRGMLEAGRDLAPPQLEAKSNGNGVQGYASYQPSAVANQSRSGQDEDAISALMTMEETLIAAPNGMPAEETVAVPVQAQARKAAAANMHS